jgi:hypothetical protein
MEGEIGRKILLPTAKYIFCTNYLVDNSLALKIALC